MKIKIVGEIAKVTLHKKSFVNDYYESMDLFDTFINNCQLISNKPLSELEMFDLYKKIFLNISWGDLLEELIDYDEEKPIINFIINEVVISGLTKYTNGSFDYNKGTFVYEESRVDNYRTLMISCDLFDDYRTKHTAVMGAINEVLIDYNKPLNLMINIKED